MREWVDSAGNLSYFKLFRKATMKKIDQNYKEITKPKKEFVKCQKCKKIFRNDEFTIVRVGGIGSRQINCLKCNSKVRG